MLTTDFDCDPDAPAILGEPSQRVQALVRVTGDTLRVPQRVRSGRPGLFERSEFPGRPERTLCGT